MSGAKDAVVRVLVRDEIWRGLREVANAGIPLVFQHAGTFHQLAEVA